jgi:hypothetical protein
MKFHLSGYVKPILTSLSRLVSLPLGLKRTSEPQVRRAHQILPMYGIAGQVELGPNSRPLCEPIGSFSLLQL